MSRIVTPVVLLLLALLLLALACAAPRSIRDVTYPRDFRYYTKEELSTVMGRMAEDVAQLDAILRGGAEEPETRRRVVELLRDLEVRAEGLEAPGALTNHPRLARNLPLFLKAVEAARRDAERDPPRYYLAGNIVGACLHCHRQPDLP